MAEHIDNARHCAELIVAALEAYEGFPSGSLFEAVRRPGTWPSAALTEAINSPFRLTSKTTLSRRDALRFSLRECKRAIDAEDVDRRLEAVLAAAVKWDEDASQVALANKPLPPDEDDAPFPSIMEALHQQIRGLGIGLLGNPFKGRKQSGLARDFGPTLARRRMEVVKLAQDAAQWLRVRVLVLKDEVPKGKPGRPEKRPGLAQLAAEMWTAGATYKDIAKCWNDKQTDEKQKVTAEQVRGLKRSNKKRRY
ncbi:MAG: hypothetical protein ACK5UC_02170 [Planctomycetaceae bacterium]|jgi:hypothetical protein